MGKFLVAAAGTGKLTGPEAELTEAAGLAPGQIPMEIWDVPGPAEQRGTEQRAITAAPGTVGVNLDPLRPMVFAPFDHQQIDPSTCRWFGSGTFATGTIATAAMADAVAKSAEVPEHRRDLDGRKPPTPKRVGASLNLAVGRYRRRGALPISKQSCGNTFRLLSPMRSSIDQMLNGDGHE